MSPAQPDRVALTSASRKLHPRSRPDEPPVKNPERLRYLLELLQQELSMAK
jgi:hypothetical protein